MSGTVIDTRINGTSTSKPFTGNVGTLKADSLSPVLLTIYLEHALKEVRPTLPRPTASFEEEIPNEVAYADNVDFIGQNYADIKKIQEVLKKNTSLKSTRTRQSTHQYQKAKKDGKSRKVGSLIDDDKDVERRKQLATVALYKLNNFWIKGNKLKTSTKIKLYNSLVKSILLYNCGTWALTLTEKERLNAYHRKQLKRILNIRFAKKITNKSFYRICQEKPVSLQILSAR